MKSMIYVAVGMTLCVLCALVGFLMPHVQAFPYLTIALSVTTGMLCIGGILRYMINGNI